LVDNVELVYEEKVEERCPKRGADKKDLFSKNNVGELQIIRNVLNETASSVAPRQVLL